MPDMATSWAHLWGRVMCAVLSIFWPIFWRHSGDFGGCQIWPLLGLICGAESCVLSCQFSGQFFGDILAILGDARYGHFLGSFVGPSHVCCLVNFLANFFGDIL